ncbi:MAG: hypothetical protein HGA96_02290 [Desulfobulbaceae bacterium]|nr:hypothetical protein [Desulfobulbaceae bacterium]
MVKILIAIALLASLFYTVQHLHPPAEPPASKVAASRAEKSVEGAPGETPSGFNPVVPESLPDVEKGYIFSEKRRIEKDAPIVEVKPVVVEPGPEVLDSVVYTGSVIIGEMRRALVIFQEPPQAGAPAAPATPGTRPGGGRRLGTVAAASPSAPQNKQLHRGDRLLGFVVAAIEPDRIVFEKGTLKVEKFLYDRNKKRLVATTGRAETPPPITTPGGIPLEAFVPPEVAAEVAASPAAAQRFMAGGGVARPAAPGDGASDQAAAQSARMVRRSQRLFSGDSSIKVPFTPVPGRPVPKE